MALVLLVIALSLYRLTLIFSRHSSQLTSSSTPECKVNFSSYAIFLFLQLVPTLTVPLISPVGPRGSLIPPESDGGGRTDFLGSNRLTGRFWKTGC